LPYRFAHNRPSFLRKEPIGRKHPEYDILSIAVPKFFHKIPRVLVVLTPVQKAHHDKLQGILKYARQHGPWDVQTLEGRTYISQLGVLKTWRPDGIITRDAERTRELLRMSHLRTPPMVVLDSIADAPRHRFVVAHDPQSVGEPVADFYMRQGLRHFAFVDAVPPMPWSSARAVSFEARLAQNGYACARYVPVSVDDLGQEQAHMRRWLLALPKPCGLLAALDLQAKQILDTCLSAGIRVPDEIAVIGVDNDELLCENTTPTLSSVLPDFEGGGYLAAELLARLMQGQRLDPTTLTYGLRRIVHRQSSQYTPRVLTRLALNAAEFIRIHACAGIGVSDVAQHLRVSRRLAELRFREAFGRSILEEIQARRLERVCTLLRETALPIGEIGRLCGYQAETYLKVLFKKRFGTTMTEFRRNGCSQ